MSAWPSLREELDWSVREGNTGPRTHRLLVALQAALVSADSDSRLYEELREAIDDGSETFTHADALNWVKTMHLAWSKIWQRDLGELVCPYDDSLHLHHDGCPSCWEHESAECKPEAGDTEDDSFGLPA